MTSFAPLFSSIGGLICCFLLVSGCGQSPEEARKDLADLGVEYSAEEFVKAAYNRDRVVVELFIAAEMDLDRPAVLTDVYDDPIEHTALSASSVEPNMDVVNVLLEAGADPKASTRDVSPLSVASAQGHWGLVERLLEYGADVNLQPLEGVTPLMAAAGSGHKDVVELLIEEGADLDIASRNSGYRAVEFAEMMGHSELVELLVDAGSVLDAAPEVAEDFDATKPSTELTIRTVDDQMLFAQERFTVRTGDEISVTLDNSGTTSRAMMHNMVILRSNSDAVVDRVGQAGLMAGSDRNYIPSDESILAYSDIAEPGEVVDLTFMAPEETGEYRYICTYPGHYGVMQGVMVVID